MEELFDLIIIGGGPGGLGAAIYAGRSKLKTLVIEKGSYGGRIKDTKEIMNYPGVPKVSGRELMERFKDHAGLFPTIKWMRTTVKGIEKEENIIKVQTKRKGDFFAKTLILDLGTQPRVLGIPGEKEFTGRGVAYCATCDADAFKEQHVFVLGSGDQAIEEAGYISKFASKVTVIVLHEENHLDCNEVAAQEAYKNEKIDFIWNSTLQEVKGDDKVRSVVVKNIKTGKLTKYEAGGVFFFVGMAPATEFAEDVVECDSQGYIKVNKEKQTSVNGIYAIGDCTDTYLRQVITAVSDGAVASVSSERYIKEMETLNHLLSNPDQKLAFVFYSPYDDGILDKVNQVEMKLKKDRTVVKQDISRQRNLYNQLNIKSNFALAIYENGEFQEIIDLSDDKYWQQLVKK